MSITQATLARVGHRACRSSPHPSAGERRNPRVSSSIIRGARQAPCMHRWTTILKPTPPKTAARFGNRSTAVRPGPCLPSRNISASKATTITPCGCRRLMIGTSLSADWICISRWMAALSLTASVPGKAPVRGSRSRTLIITSSCRHPITARPTRSCILVMTAVFIAQATFSPRMPIPIPAGKTSTTTWPSCSSTAVQASAQPAARSSAARRTTAR